MTIKNYLLILLAILSTLFVVFPHLDIYFSDKFYDQKIGFIFSNNFFVNLIFRCIPVITKLWATLCSVMLLVKFVNTKSIKITLKSPIMFLLVAAVLGPGLVVNYGLKEHVGRARPKAIKEFGGTEDFTPALTLSDACSTNCSFSSGHAAMAFYFTSLAWITAVSYQNLVLIITSSFGLLVGLGRVMQGGHFISDVIFSFLIILLNEFCFRVWKSLYAK